MSGNYYKLNAKGRVLTFSLQSADFANCVANVICFPGTTVISRLSTQSTFQSELHTPRVLME